MPVIPGFEKVLDFSALDSATFFFTGPEGVPVIRTVVTDNAHISKILGFNWGSASTGIFNAGIGGGQMGNVYKAITDDKRKLGTADVTGDGVVKLSLGKKKHVLLKPV